MAFWRMLLVGIATSPLLVDCLSAQNISTRGVLDRVVTGAFNKVEDGLPVIWTNNISETPFASLQLLVDAVRNESKRARPINSVGDEHEVWVRSLPRYSRDEVRFIQCLGGAGDPLSFIDRVTVAWSKSLKGTQDGGGSRMTTEKSAWRDTSYCVRVNATVNTALRDMEHDLAHPQYLPLTLTDRYFRKMAPLSAYLKDQFQKCDIRILLPDNNIKDEIEAAVRACTTSTRSVVDALENVLDAFPEQLRSNSSLARKAVQEMFSDADARRSTKTCIKRGENLSIVLAPVVYIGEYTFPSFEKGEVSVTCHVRCGNASALQQECAEYLKKNLNSFKLQAEDFVIETLDRMASRLNVILSELQRASEQLSSVLKQGLVLV